ncbi:7510_t:CDS:2 [Entrophospora sp. SA101]|nr:7510_t:CDS:2 [Entrophospora sp. SA101]
MTMAPINKFQHPLDANFEKLVLNEYNNINNIKLPEQQQQSKLESKEYYIKEYLSAVRPKLLKKLVEELSMEDKLNLLNDKSKVWIKLLQFGENHRPSYYGTWTKTSKKITGRRPFAKDPDYFDYDYDSEAEWELDDGEELKTYELTLKDEDFLVPDSYLSEDEGVEESDESINLSAESSPNKKNVVRKERGHRMIEPMKEMVIGPIFEEVLGDKNHQLSEYSIQFLNYNNVQIVNESLAESYEDVTLEEDEEQILSSLQSSETIINTNNDEVLDISLEFNSQPIVLIENDIEDFDMNSLVNEVIS